MGRRRRWVSTVIRGWKRGEKYLSTSQVYHKLWVWLLLWHAKFLAELRRKKFKSYLQPLWNTFLPIYAFQFRASGLECRVRAFSGWPKTLSGLRASSLARTHHYGKGSLAREQEEEEMWSRICHREKHGKHGNRYLIGLACTRHCSHAKAGKLLLQFCSKEGKAEFLTWDLTLRDVSAGSIVWIVVSCFSRCARFFGMFISP